jgi:hypothetical protein
VDTLNYSHVLFNMRSGSRSTIPRCLVHRSHDDEDLLYNTNFLRATVTYKESEAWNTLYDDIQEATTLHYER